MPNIRLQRHAHCLVGALLQDGGESTWKQVRGQRLRELDVRAIEVESQDSNLQYPLTRPKLGFPIAA